MADYTSPYADIPSYGKGPKSLYSTNNEEIFEVILNVPQMDDDDEWGKTETIALRQIIDRVTTIVQEVEDPNATGTSGLVNQVTALRRVILLDNNVFTSGITNGCSLSIGSTQISSTVAAFGGSVTALGTVSAVGSLNSGSGLNITGSSILWGDLTACGNVSTYGISVNGPLNVVDGDGGSAALSIAGPIAGESVTAGSGRFNYLVTEDPGTSTFCGNVRVESVAGLPDDTGSLTVDKQITTGSLTATSVIAGVASFSAISVAEADQDTSTFFGAVNIVKVTGVPDTGFLTVEDTLTTLALNVLDVSHFYGVSNFCGSVFIGTDGITNTVTHKGNYILSNGYATIPIIAGNTSFSNNVTITGTLNLDALAWTQTIAPSVSGGYSLGSADSAYLGVYLTDRNSAVPNPYLFFFYQGATTPYLGVRIGATNYYVALTNLSPA